jgi:hypothetical protein
MTETLDTEAIRAELEAADEYGQREWALRHGPALLDALDAARADLAALRERIDEARRDFQGDASRRKALGEECEDVQNAADALAWLFLRSGPSVCQTPAPDAQAEGGSDE